MMRAQSDALQGLYLEDSCLLGIAVSGTQLRLNVLFALSGDHPEYRGPIPSEQHCYREGEIRWHGVQMVSSGGERRLSVLTDPDGTLDLGSVWCEQSGDVHHVSADAFDLTFTAADVEVVLAP